MASAQEQLQHVAQAVMHGIHDVFPEDNDDDNDPISNKKLKKGRVNGTSTRRYSVMILMGMQRP
jgi:hypothetical protein